MKTRKQIVLWAVAALVAVSLFAPATVLASDDSDFTTFQRCFPRDISAVLVK